MHVERKAEQRSSLGRNVVFLESELETVDNRKEKFRIVLAKDGMPRAVAFFDIDGTLADLKFIHGLAVQKLFPFVNPDEITRTYFAGFKLGSSYREFDRLHQIYINGKSNWKDPEEYRTERFDPQKNEIDKPGHDAHDIAAQYVSQYGQIISGTVKKIYETEPAKLEQAKIKPVFRFAEMLKRLGIPMFIMTANGREFTRNVAKYMGLANLFIDIATDETMNGGGKEISIRHLLNVLKRKGLQVPDQRLIVVGDSFCGDIGSAARLDTHNNGVKNQGILVLENMDEFAGVQDQIKTDAELQEIVSKVDTQALVVGNVSLDRYGKPILSSRFRNNFLFRLP